MKRLFASVLAGLLMLSVGTASAFAASSANANNCINRNITVCESGSANKHCRGNSIGCKAALDKKSTCTNYVDVNDDGICDNCTAQPVERRTNCKGNRCK